MSSTRKPPEHLRPAYNLPEAAAAAEAAEAEAAAAEAAEAEAAEVAEVAEAAEAVGAAAAVEAAAAVCRGELAPGARLGHFPITLTDASRHDRVWRGSTGPTHDG